MNARRDKRVLAVDPIRRGFGFVVLEGAACLVDWGVKEARGSDRSRILKQLVGLFDRYQPDLLLVEDLSNSRRGERAKGLVAQASRLATARRLRVRMITQRKARALFVRAGASTKHAAATVVAEHFPELQPHLPPKRKPWMTEDARMAIFDAAALGLGYFFQH